MTSDELVTLMVEHKLNVKKLASMVPVTPNCVYRWIKGTRKIPLLAAEKLQARLALPSGKVLRLGDNWSVR